MKGIPHISFKEVNKIFVYLAFIVLAFQQCNLFVHILDKNNVFIELNESAEEKEEKSEDIQKELFSIRSERVFSLNTALIGVFHSRNSHLNHYFLIKQFVHEVLIPPPKS